MTNRKGERTSRMNEREYANIVQVPLPLGGFGRTLDQIHHFHSERDIDVMHGRYIRRDDIDYVRWCFADQETAQAFAAAFGGVLVDAVKNRDR